MVTRSTNDAECLILNGRKRKRVKAKYQPYAGLKCAQNDCQVVFEEAGNLVWCGGEETYLCNQHNNAHYNSLR